MNFLLRIFLLIFPLLMCSSCEETFPELPEETQSGAQTFGCLVNNELVFARNTWLDTVGYMEAIYYTKSDKLIIKVTCQLDQQFIFHIDHPQEGEESELSQIRYLPPDSNNWIEVNDTGRLHLTRFSTWFSKGVVSGTFSLELPETNGKIINVTKGRFDLNLGLNMSNYQN